ncbi:hypothetical protein GUITHDRAFT_109115 [Guillardia theta CCMP2712]|uniref:Uncharacterized protein n=2 Tax=Guillardia theta TaxID=55529 RepID=L1J964_GUITC|nr:hypothetical protein GUITHDRAFT_109115 [Guillardia theta CCMP2712]EKX45071.1 hypothetical protein GUITHDRAFT_109115 [Guillardia theta CCMP2712]|eukprot:XP_005832051.1 hypothetical protein GUITHDRAFT_109115 [Guillardia theta CCMP2712]
MVRAMAESMDQEEAAAPRAMQPSPQDPLICHAPTMPAARRRITIAVSSLLACALVACLLISRQAKTSLLSVIFPGSILARVQLRDLTAIRNAGSDAHNTVEWGRDSAMRKAAETDVGVPGWEPGPDYYSTRRWDNMDVMPSHKSRFFEPYTGKTGCPSCDNSAYSGPYVISVSDRCDHTAAVSNIKMLLKPQDHLEKIPNIAASKYEDYTWIENQLELTTLLYSKVIYVVPPCFFPTISRHGLNILDRSIYTRGNNILLLGGYSGADFLSRFLAGDDGYGYVRTGNIDEYSTEKSRMDVVWSEGPFYMQNDATTTEFFYGPRLLEGLGDAGCACGTVAIPASELPENTVFYYMDQNDNAVIFEIPAGQGRILFIGYDYGAIVPHWSDILLLAERELELPERSVSVVTDS